MFFNFRVVASVPVVRPCVCSFQLTFTFTTPYASFQLHTIISLVLMLSTFAPSLISECHFIMILIFWRVEVLAQDMHDQSYL